MSTANHPPADTAAPAALDTSEAWLEKNFKSVIVGAVVLIAVVIVGGVVRYRTDAVAREAGAAFTSAETVEELDAVISTHSGSQAAANALLAKAEQLWEKNQKDSSVAALQKFLETHGSHSLAPLAKLGLASKLDAMGEKAKAKSQYEELISQHADSDVTPLAEIRLGDLLWSEGKVEEAKAIYSSLPSKYPGTNQPFFDQSQERLKWIGAALPTKEVDPPPAPEKKPEDAAAPAAGVLPPIQLGEGGKPLAPMNITVSPNTSATSPAVEVKPGAEAPAPAPEAKPEPAPAKPAPPKEDDLKLEVPMPQAPEAPAKP